MAISPIASIRGRTFSAVDHDKLDGPFRRFELEAELFLQRGEQGRAVAWWGTGGGVRRFGAKVVRRPRQMEIEAASESSPIHDHAVDVGAEVGGKRGQSLPGRLDGTRCRADGAAQSAGVSRRPGNRADN